jgi:hypothetical protein
MTRLLKKAFDQASQLPESEQERFALLIMAELESERRWTDLFASTESEDLLERLADEAVVAHRQGKTAPLDPKEL